MPTLQADNIVDMVTTTQKDLGRMKWTEIASDLQEYVAMDKLLKKEKVQYESGIGIQFNVMVDTTGQARNTGLFGTDNINQGDHMTVGSIPWRHATANYSFDRREVAMNRSPAKIVDLVKQRRATCMIDQAVLHEGNFWGKPTDSNDNLKPYGIDYWIVRNATEGFTGGIPSGFSNVGGISPTTYPNWKNWSAQYTNVTKDDFVRKMRKAATYTKFKSPATFDSYERSQKKYGYYTNYGGVGTLEELLEDQNDNLGNDIASKDGAVIFRRIPVEWVPQLDADTANPVYGINWSVFCPVVLAGEHMKENPPVPAPNQHTVMVVHVDTTLNWLCYNRRLCFVIYK